jgi:hypothetical protein
MFALDRPRHGPRLIKAQDLLAVIDEQIEMRKEILTQYSAYARVCCSQLRDGLNDCERLCDRMTSNLNQVEKLKRAPRLGSNAAHSGCAIDSRMKV